MDIVGQLVVLVVGLLWVGVIAAQFLETVRAPRVVVYGLAVLSLCIFSTLCVRDGV